MKYPALVQDLIEVTISEKDVEKQQVVTDCDHLAQLKFSKTCPYAFTGHGALMAANVLNSPDAVKMSVYVVWAFIKQRELLMAQSGFHRGWRVGPWH